MKHHETKSTKKHHFLHRDGESAEALVGRGEFLRCFRLRFEGGPGDVGEVGTHHLMRDMRREMRREMPCGSGFWVGCHGKSVAKMVGITV